MKITIPIPKGTRAHEMVSLPGFWYNLSRVDTGDLKITRLQYGKHGRQYLLRVNPLPGAPRKHAVVVYFHGGGWRFGKPEFFLPNAKVLASRGYEVYLPSVRRIPVYNFTHIRNDLAALLKKILAAGQSESGIAPRIILGGMSAGGNLAALTVLDEESRKGTGLSRTDLAGLFLCGAPLNLRQMAPSLMLTGFAGQREGPLFSQANPYDQLTSHERIPVLCIHGEQDGLVEFKSTCSFIQKLKEVNQAPTVFEVVPNGTHLDSCAWAHEDGRLRALLLDWLEQYCNS